MAGRAAAGKAARGLGTGLFRGEDVRRLRKIALARAHMTTALLPFMTAGLRDVQNIIINEGTGIAAFIVQVAAFQQAQDRCGRLPAG